MVQANNKVQIKNILKTMAPYTTGAGSSLKIAISNTAFVPCTASICNKGTSESFDSAQLNDFLW